MTITPERLRQLSRRGVQHNDGQDYIVPARDIVEYNAALRAAADQLDAVQDVVNRMPFTASRQALTAILTADTAPQKYADGGPITGGRYWAGTAPQEDRDE